MLPSQNERQLDTSAERIAAHLDTIPSCDADQLPTLSMAQNEQVERHGGLHTVQRLSYKEVARRMGRSVAVVRRLRARAVIRWQKETELLDAPQRE
jgi:hypothetical protein